MLSMPSDRSMLKDNEDLPPLTLHTWQWRTGPVLSPCVRTSEAADTAQSQEHHRLAASWSLCTEPVVMTHRHVKKGHDACSVTDTGNAGPKAQALWALCTLFEQTMPCSPACNAWDLAK